MGEFTQSEIRAKERQLQDIRKKASACLEKEKEINARLSQLRRSGRPAAQTEREASALEGELSNVLREHERYEGECERISRELDRLRQNAMWEESLHREEEKRKQTQKRWKDDLSGVVTFSAGALAGAAGQSKRSQPQKKKSGSGCLGAVGKWLIIFVIIGVVIDAITSQNPSRFERHKTPKSAEETEMTQQETGLSQWIGMTAEDIFAQYGEEFSVNGLGGGMYFCYEDESLCPYNFYYEGEASEPEPGDRIYGVDTWGDGICVMDDIRIGENLQQIEEKLGYSLTPEALEGSDFYPLLEEGIQNGGIYYHLLFGTESKNLIRATAMEKEWEGGSE